MKEQLLDFGFVAAMLAVLCGLMATGSEGDRVELAIFYSRTAFWLITFSAICGTVWLLWDAGASLWIRWRSR